MHISPGLTIPRRTAGLSRIAGAGSPQGVRPHGAWLRKVLPGVILLVLLVLIGGLFPVVF